MGTVTSKGQVTVPKLLRDRLGIKPGSQVDFIVNAHGEIVLQPAKKPVNKAADTYRKALLSVSGSADKRFSTTDDYMRFIRG
jgi:antitoxin PrlF